MHKQTTIKNDICLEGIGLHTATKVAIELKSGAIDSGICFQRTDVVNAPVMKASIETLFSLSESSRRSTIGTADVHVQTIEHLMAALSGLRVDNVLVQVNAAELPGLDGSAQQFAKAIIQAGIIEQDRERKFLTIKEPVFVEDNGASIVALPYDGFKVAYTLDYKQPFSKTEFLELELTPDIFLNEIAPARTFCLDTEAHELQRKGIGKGATYDNTLVLGKDGVIKNSLRFSDEFVRHKILDLIGDLFLVGMPLKAHIVAIRSGHALNLKLAKKIASLKEAQQTNNVSALSSEIGEAPLDINQIMNILPHREPFLFVDRILHLERGKRAIGIKNVTINDYFFRGHFPGKPVMPGVIIVEAMAQVGGVMMLAASENRGKLAYFMAANEIKFRKTVLPGDQLVMEVEARKIKSKTGQVYAKALVDGKVVCEGELMFALAEV